MDIQEFSTQFEVLYNNVTSNQAPGLNEYEKSVFLTKAEFQLINEYFNNRTDGVGGGFDGSQKRQYDFSSLIRVERLFNVNTFKTRVEDSEKLDRRSQVYLFPQNYFLAVNEIISDAARQYSVMPLDYGEYQRLMLKPYNFPVKRGAWRLMTDKKNCNYCREYVETSDTLDYSTDNRKTETDYVIMSSWADQKRNISLFLIAKKNGVVSDVTDEISTFTGDTYTTETYPWNGNMINLVFSKKWDDSHLTYKIGIGVVGKVEDDEEVMQCLQDFFKEHIGEQEDIVKIKQHLDGMVLCSAPSKFKNFFKEGTNVGKVFTTEVIQVPMAEIIGKFTGEINYQLRYIRTLKPIILEDLTNYGEDLSIEGITQATECELPVETHQEILERAVTLAKIAWAGGTATQATAQQRKSE